MQVERVTWRDHQVSVGDKWWTLWEVREKAEKGWFQHDYGAVIYEDANNLVLGTKQGGDNEWKGWTIILKVCIVSREVFAGEAPYPA